MKSYLLNFLIPCKREYIFIFLTATIFSIFSFTKTFSEENVFTVNNVSIKASIDLNFSRDKYINKSFEDSFNILMKKILLRRDLEKVQNVNLKKIRSLIKSFQILEESYRQYKYTAKIKIVFNDTKVKNFLREKNISFSQPENITVVFFPILFVNNEVQNFNENYFHKNWEEVKILNDSINFILPIEDLDDISMIVKMKDRIEDINIDPLINKYDVKNYVFALIDYNEQKLNIHLKTNFNEQKVSKNFLYNIKSIDDKLSLKNISEDLKLKINDLWKEENLVNLLMPLSIDLKFNQKSIRELDELNKIFYEISIIDKHQLKEFNINDSHFKIYYYGNPKKLKTELLRFGYNLENDQGSWKLYK